MRIIINWGYYVNSRNKFQEPRPPHPPNDRRVQIPYACNS